jgi:hypothetical protein
MQISAVHTDTRDHWMKGNYDHLRLLCSYKLFTQNLKNDYHADISCSHRHKEITG